MLAQSASVYIARNMSNIKTNVDVPSDIAYCNYWCQK